MMWMSYVTTELAWSDFFFFMDPATTEIYPLSLPDALPIWHGLRRAGHAGGHDGRRLHRRRREARCADVADRYRDGDGVVFADARHVHRRRSHGRACGGRSEEHTSELQSQSNLVCRLLLEKK